MLIGQSGRKPNLDKIRHIKQVLRDALDLPEDATITLTELACMEEDCPPVETVFGLLRSDAPQLQHKVHKTTEEVDADDLLEICKAWGLGLHADAFESFVNDK
ncbi:MAG: hypothetical protein CMP98_07575 [Gammaproteobacteria bacterium]|nr:hypothetical protein [Gammaproteobacteria bacterium]OUU09333.1 MAG: hypothetical protein CBB94_07735 [Gammaproteobacteria bacterium TMED34]